jgi:chromosome segregation ATPase
MTDDDLMKRLQIGWHDEDTPPWVSNAMSEAKTRIETLTAERDKAYASGYSDAETEISKSALGQRNDFLHSQYANAADHIKSLTAKLADAMEGLEKCQAELDEYSHQEYPLDHPVHERYRQRDYDANPARITLAALKGESHD